MSAVLKKAVKLNHSLREPHWNSMGLPEISRVTWQVCKGWGGYCENLGWKWLCYNGATLYSFRDCVCVCGVTFPWYFASSVCRVLCSFLWCRYWFTCVIGGVTLVTNTRITKLLPCHVETDLTHWSREEKNGRYFRTNFLQRKYLYFYANFLEIYSQGSN